MEYFSPSANQQEQRLENLIEHIDESARSDPKESLLPPSIQKRNRSAKQSEASGPMSSKDQLLE